jgi:Lon protease-like protein
MDTLPTRLGIFPLPDLVLFPDTLLPLHVFEPRYRALLADAVADSRRIVMGVLEPGWEADYEGSPAIHPTACVGRVVEHQLLQDGCSDLILRGEAVVRLEEVPSEKPYRTAKIVKVTQEGCFATAPEAGERCAELRRLLEGACPGCVKALQERWPVDFKKEGSLELLHTIAMHLPVSVEKKLEWLACPGSLARWEKIRETLEEMGETRGAQRRVIRRYDDLHPDDPVTN